MLATPRLLGEDLFIITSEFSQFDRTSERLDILAVDARGKLVLVELKRSAVGTHAELQALRYAAYCSNLSLEDIADLHAEYLRRRGEDASASDALQRMREFVQEPTFEALDNKPRIILAAEEFPPEITATVMWLRSFELDLTCVRLRPHLVGEHLVLDSSVLIPLPEARAFMMGRERKEVESSRMRAAGPTTVEELAARLTPQVQPLFENVRQMLTSEETGSIERLFRSGIGYRRRTDGSWVTWLETTASELRVAIPPEAENIQLLGVKMFGAWPVVSVRNLDEAAEAIRLLGADYGVRHHTMGSPETVRDYYVSFGEGVHRDWDDAIRYGYVSAGQGLWYSQTLRKLAPETRIFVYLPQKGYVGVGIVREPAVPIREFTVDVEGERVPILQAPRKAPRMDENSDDPEKSEYVVRVEWIKTLPRDEAYRFEGMFANQNSACRLTHRPTLDALIQRFELEVT
ncbi:MAG TPA: hypothetical protein VEW03_05380 [Longimicrobiaceae bacterium]|nr:hypothetical protein [Longimicrobiaceae bacterium]